MDPIQQRLLALIAWTTSQPNMGGQHKKDNPGTN